MPSPGFKQLLDFVSVKKGPHYVEPRHRTREPEITAEFVEWYKDHRDGTSSADEAILCSGCRVDALIVGKRGIVVAETKRLGPDYRDIGQAIGYGLEVLAMCREVGRPGPVNVVLAVGYCTMPRAQQHLVYIWSKGKIRSRGRPVHEWPKELGPHDLLMNTPNRAHSTMLLLKNGHPAE